MNRRTQILFIIIVTVPLLAAIVWFALNGESDSEESAFRQVRDMTGRVVRIPAEPRRILSLCSCATDTIVRFGKSDKIAAIDAYNRIIPGIGEAAVIGKGSALSREQIRYLGIDLAFIWWYQDDAADLLETLSIPVVRIRSGSAEQVPGMIHLIGECLRCPAKAELLADNVADYIRAASIGKENDLKQRVYFELYGPFKTVGGETYISDLIELAGAENIAAEASGSVLLSIERLIEADPDVILFVKDFETVESISARGGMSTITAVERRRIYPIDRYRLVAGAGLPESVEIIREILNSNVYSYSKR